MSYTYLPTLGQSSREWMKKNKDYEVEEGSNLVVGLQFYFLLEMKGMHEGLDTEVESVLEKIKEFVAQLG